MKVVLQRVQNGEVRVNNKTVGKIESGYVLLVGIGKDDTQDSIKKMAEKILKLRVMSDEDNKMNLSIRDVTGEILCISQFTLYADTTAGNRPSFINAAPPEKARELFDQFVQELKTQSSLKVETSTANGF